MVSAAASETEVRGTGSFRYPGKMLRLNCIGLAGSVGNRLARFRDVMGKKVQ
jgi:hypothetical protein